MLTCVCHLAIRVRVTDVKRPDEPSAEMLVNVEEFIGWQTENVDQNPKQTLRQKSEHV